MPFDVRCPSCKARMRFEDDELPKRGDPIDCPKCNTTFPAPSSTAFEEKKPAGAKKEEKGREKGKEKRPRTVEAVPRTYFNHWLLLLITGGLMGILLVTLSVIWAVVAKAAKAEDMVACVPDNFNVIRGVNLKTLRNYPGIQKNGEKFYDAEAQGIYDEAAKKVGLGKDDLAYYVCAREAGSNAVLHLFGTTPNFNPADLGDGQPVQLSRGVTATAATRNLIVAASGRNAQSTLTTAAGNARSKPRDGMHTKLGTTGKLATRGQMWSVFRMEGSMKGWTARGMEGLKEDGALSKLRDATGKASVLATWVSFGSTGVRVGAGIELAESKEAGDLVNDMKKGPLGKADESEPPNGFKKSMQSVGNVSQTGAFWQYLEYRSQGSCAYIVSKLEDPEKYATVIGEFTNPSRGAGPAGAGGFGGF
jgi:predicted Zn finger-like uncharacterized protein